MRPADFSAVALEHAAARSRTAGADPAQWQVDVAESRPRAAKDPGGAVVSLTDAVVRARRR